MLIAIKAIAKCDVNIILISASVLFFHKQGMKTTPKWDIDCIMMLSEYSRGRELIFSEVSWMRLTGEEEWTASFRISFLWPQPPHLQSPAHSNVSPPGPPQRLKGSCDPPTLTPVIPPRFSAGRELGMLVTIFPKLAEKASDPWILNSQMPVLQLLSQRCLIEVSVNTNLHCLELHSNLIIHSQTEEKGCEQGHIFSEIL